MIVTNDEHRYRLTASAAAKHLVYRFGAGSLGMGENQWNKVIVHSKLTARERENIRLALAKQVPRVRKYLGVPLNNG